MKEIITLQVGNYANYVGTHFWNIQDATLNQNFERVRENQQYKPYMDASVLYREGETMEGRKTYTPRVVIMDRKGARGSLAKQGYQYNNHKITNTVGETRQQIANQYKNQVQSWNTNAIEMHMMQPIKSTQYITEMNSLMYDDEKEGYDEEEENKDRRYRSDSEDDEEDEGNRRESFKHYMKQFEQLHDQQELFQHQQKEEQQKEEQKEEEQKKEYDYDMYMDDFDKNTKYWSDFLNPYLHPKSIVELQQYNHNGIDFNTFTEGMDIMKNDRVFDEYETSIHHFAEECDTLQGFQMLFDGHNGFAGASSKMIENLRDEFGNKVPVQMYQFGPIVRQNLNQTDLEYSRAKSLSLVNQAISMCATFDLTRSIIPLIESTIPSETSTYKVNMDLPFHTSSLFALAIDSVSMFWKRRENPISMVDYLDTLQIRNSFKCHAIQTRIPFEHTQGQSLYEIFNASKPLHEHHNTMNFSVMPQLYKMKEKLKTCYFAHSIFLRGLNMDKIPLYIMDSTANMTYYQQIQMILAQSQRGSSLTEKYRLNKHLETKENKELVDCTTWKEMTQKYYDQTRAFGKVDRFLQDTLELPQVFPRIFKDPVDEDGFIVSHAKPTRTKRIPIMAQQIVTPAIGAHLKFLGRVMKNCSSSTSIRDTQLDADSYLEYAEQLDQLHDDYVDFFSDMVEEDVDTDDDDY